MQCEETPFLLEAGHLPVVVLLVQRRHKVAEAGGRCHVLWVHRCRLHAVVSLITSSNLERDARLTMTGIGISSVTSASPQQQRAFFSQFLIASRRSILVRREVQRDLSSEQSCFSIEGVGCSDRESFEKTSICSRSVVTEGVVRAKMRKHIVGEVK
jgi:hypothetical protein